MSYDLPRIREQLKRKLPKLLKEKDTMTLIWFSGRGEFGTLLEGEPVGTLTDLQNVEKAIDRWLRPIGLTGFTEPLREAGKVVQRVSKAHPGSVNSLFFMSDGCDNQGSRTEILRAMEDASNGFQSTTIVEYGYYADRNLLSALAEKAGGVHIFAEDFAKYEPAFEAVLSKRPSAAPRIEVEISGDPIGGFVFALQDGDLVTYAVEAGKVRVPKNVGQLWFMSPALLGVESMMAFDENVAHQVRSASKSNQFADNIRAAFAAVSLYAVRMKPNVVYPLLKVLGDVDFIEEFANCFGKQKYSAFQERAKKAAFGEGLYTRGYDPSKVPADDAFTILDLLHLLASDESNRVLLDHPDFTYSRIGRGRVDASEQLTEEEQAEMQALTTELSGTKKTARIKEINQRIAEITDKPAALKFEADPAPIGYSISSLVFNEDRPNVSFMVRKTGKVDLSERLERDAMDKVPDVINTHVFRNYAVIKDGLVNIEKLPVNISPATYEALQAKLGPNVFHVMRVDSSTGYTGVLSLKEMPVINRKMVRDVSAKQFFQLQYELLSAQAEAKVYNSYAKDLLPQERSAGLRDTYGEDAAEWLKEQGITDGGFSPKGILAESTDFYLGKELKISLKGYSKLPSLKEAQAQIAKGKLNGPGSLMAPTIQMVEDFLGSDLYKKSGGGSAALQVWLDTQQKAAKARVREIIFQIAQTTFAIVVGQTWFKEFASLDENAMTIEPQPGTQVECKAELKEVQIKI
jgi:hypothetical protein